MTQGYYVQAKDTRLFLDRTGTGFIMQSDDHTPFVHSAEALVKMHEKGYLKGAKTILSAEFDPDTELSRATGESFTLEEFLALQKQQAAATA